MYIMLRNLQQSTHWYFDKQILLQKYSIDQDISKDSDTFFIFQNIWIQWRILCEITLTCPYFYSSKIFCKYVALRYATCMRSLWGKCKIITVALKGKEKVFTSQCNTIFYWPNFSLSSCLSLPRMSCCE